MRELSREYLNVPEWYYIGIEAGDMLRSMVSNAQGVEDALSSFRETIAPYGGYSFASRLDDVDRMERAAQAMVNCRKYLSEEFDELIDAPLKRRFNYMMDELATIDVNDFKVKNTLGIEGVAYVGKEDREEIRELPNLTLEDFVGSNLNEFDNSRLRHIEKVEGISKIFEESYGYLMEGGILDESLSLKEYLKQYVPQEFYYKRDSSVPQKVLQSSWEGLKVTQLIDIIRGKEMFTGDHLTDEEKGYKVVIGTVDTALTAFGVGLVAKPGSGTFCKGIVIASVQDMGINATYTMMNETGFEDWAKAVSLGMTALSLYSIYRYGKAYRNGNKGNVPESEVPKETKDEVPKIQEDSDVKPPPLENAPYIKDGKPNGRPSLSGDARLQFEKDVYNNCVDPDGVLRDPNTGEVINWKPGDPRKGVVDFGHNQGNSYSEMFKKYKNGEITLDELKEFQFNPNNFRLETPSANRSHKYE